MSTVCDWIGKPLHAMHKTWNTYILLLIVIATLKHSPNTVTKLLQIRKSAFADDFCHHERPKQPLRGIDRVAWVPFCSTVCLLGSWYGQGLLWPSVWPAWHTVSTDSVNPPPLIHPPPYMRHLWHCRLCSKCLSKPDSPTSSSIC